MSYEECSECGHSTEYLVTVHQESLHWIGVNRLQELILNSPVAFGLDEDGETIEQDCSECIKQEKHCIDHGSCTIDPDVCLCGD